MDRLECFHFQISFPFAFSRKQRWRIDDTMMDKIFQAGRILFAVSIAAFGFQNMKWAGDGGPVMRILPWLPASPLLAYLVGILFSCNRRLCRIES